MQIGIVGRLFGSSCRPVTPLPRDGEEQDHCKKEDQKGHSPAQPLPPGLWRDLRFCWLGRGSLRGFFCCSVCCSHSHFSPHPETPTGPDILSENSSRYREQFPFSH